MICKDCGKENPSGLTFCKYCSSILKDEDRKPVAKDRKKCICDACGITFTGRTCPTCGAVGRSSEEKLEDIQTKEVLEKIAYQNGKLTSMSRRYLGRKILYDSNSDDPSFKKGYKDGIILGWTIVGISLLIFAIIALFIFVL